LPLGSEKDAALIWGRIRKRPAPLISVAFTVPVFIAYHLGILMLMREPHTQASRSGFDFVSRWMLRLVDASPPAYVLVTLVLALILLVTTWVHQKRGKIAESPHKRVFWEALGVAVVLSAALGWATYRVLHGSGSTLTSLPLQDRFVLAIGSGFYEEAVFRGLLITGGSRLLMRLKRLKGKSPWIGLGVCTVVSSALYVLAYYLFAFDGHLAHFNVGVAAFRMIEALLFAAVYLTRGFAVAVYAHTFYNLFSLLWFF
jgi:membrane protease YdiL (CAAX protease family)